ncbi:MAG: hypothetical protein LBM16_01005, partial [Clostridiales bacterium]|nr:hypothetical protein [Clostridiales bacterium]
MKKLSSLLIAVCLLVSAWGASYVYGAKSPNDNFVKATIYTGAKLSVRDIPLNADAILYNEAVYAKVSTLAAYTGYSHKWDSKTDVTYLTKTSVFTTTPRN